MAFDRSERGHRGDHFSRGGGADQDRRDREADDRDYMSGGYADEYPRHGRAVEQRRWRDQEYDSEEPIDRGRDHRDYYDAYDRERERPLDTEHRDRFLYRGDGEGRRGKPIGSWPRGWRGPEDLRDDERWSGPYAGRGPKGYRRSDERIQEEVCERLTEHPSIDASDIEVAVSDGDVTIAGQVESRAVKHLTEVMVETVSGVKEVHNQLRVARGDITPGSRSSEELRYRGARG